MGMLFCRFEVSFASFFGNGCKFGGSNYSNSTISGPHNNSRYEFAAASLRIVSWVRELAIYITEEDCILFCKLHVLRNFSYRLHRALNSGGCGYHVYQAGFNKRSCRITVPARISALG